MEMSNSGSSTRRSSTKKKPHSPSMATATSQLLTATKALLQSLTAWAASETPVEEVSSRFVRFGDTFKMLRRAYVSAGLPTGNLPDIPGKVRSILEQSLVLKQSQESLDIFLPKIGDTVAEMMQMLKEKQSELGDLESRKNSQSSLSLKNDSNTSLLNVSTSSTTTTTTVAPTLTVPTIPNEQTATADSMARLQHNSGLMRRASKRFSAYQTNSIISMHSTRPDSGFSPNRLPKTPETDRHIIDNEAEIEDKKELIQKRLSSSSTPDVSIDNVLDPINESPVASTPNYTNNINDVKANRLSVAKTPDPELNVIYLKLKNEVKRITLRLPTTQANIKVLFTQKFNYSPTGASSFPKIYIQDSMDNISYELEDVNDLQRNSILSLHEPDLKSEIFRHVDSQMDSIKGDMSKMEDRIFKKLELISVSNIGTASSSRNQGANSIKSQESENEYEKKMKQVIQTRKNDQKVIEDLKFELNKLKQHHERSTQSLKTSLELALTSLSDIETAAISEQGVDNNSYMKQCKDKVSNGCENLVIKLDDLQDIIEVLKLDITKRGAKPTHNQIQHITKEMKLTSNGLRDLMDFMTNDKKNWTALWSKTLNSIVEDQQFFKAQEEILSLLEQDYQSATETFELIVKCVDELDKGAAVSRPMLPIPDPSLSSEDATRMLFAEVDNINPNHNERVEAIKKLERVREMEKKIMMRNDFQEELGDFVEGEKFKHSGGIEEMERIRKEKDQSNLKTMFTGY